jgi:fluoride exporter
VTAVLVAAGAALGAPLRYALDRFVQSRYGGTLPWGTLTVNVLGSLVLGAVLRAAHASALPAGVAAFAGAGLCGGFTTFSTLCFDTWRLMEEGEVLEAELNLAVSLLAGLAAAAAGWFAAGLVC